MRSMKQFIRQTHNQLAFSEAIKQMNLLNMSCFRADKLDDKQQQQRDDQRVNTGGL
jgi:hypothetical protein